MITLREGVVTKLEVKVAGKPKPDVKWAKDNEEITPSDEYQIENFDDGTSILVINNIYPDDAGIITVEAVNTVGEAISTTELTFQGIFIIHFTKGLRCVLLLWFKLNFFSRNIFSKKENAIFLLYFSASSPYPIPYHTQTQYEKASYTQTILC